MQEAFRLVGITHRHLQPQLPAEGQQRPHEQGVVEVPYLQTEVAVCYAVTVYLLLKLPCQFVFRRRQVDAEWVHLAIVPVFQWLIA